MYIGINCISSNSLVNFSFNFVPLSGLRSITFGPSLIHMILDRYLCYRDDTNTSTLIKVHYPKLSIVVVVTRFICFIPWNRVSR